MKHVDLSTEFGEAVPQFLDERLDPFRTVFTEPTWRHASVLAMGALLAPGKRTVSSCLRITGNAECKSFSSFHQVLNRAQWEPSELSRILLQLLATNLVEEEPIVVGLDDTIERRWGPKIGNYMRKCASGGQSLANAERGMGMSGFAGKIGD